MVCIKKKKKVLRCSLAVHAMCFCSSRVKCVCYVPIYSPLNVMEPRDIPEITPPTLLLLSQRRFKSSQSNCGLSIRICIYYPPQHPTSTACSEHQTSRCLCARPVGRRSTRCGMRSWRCAAQTYLTSHSSRCKQRVIPP